MLLRRSRTAVPARQPHPSPVIESLLARLDRLQERLSEKDRDLVTILAERRKIQSRHRKQHNWLINQGKSPGEIRNRSEIQSYENRITTLLSQEASIELEQDSIGAAITELRRELAVDEATYLRQTTKTADANP